MAKSARTPRGSTGVAPGVIAGLCALLAFPWAPLASESNARRILFYHTHTDERLSIVYSVEGEYVPESLAELNRFLRDFRTGDVHEIDPELFDILWDLRRTTGGGTYEVISAYRCPATNEQLRDGSGGVAKNSLHMQGRAIDVRLTEVPTVDLRDAALKLKRGGVGYYEQSDFVHVDTGRVRRW